MTRFRDHFVLVFFFLLLFFFSFLFFLVTVARNANETIDAASTIAR